MLEQKFMGYHRATSLSSQANPKGLYSIIAEESLVNSGWQSLAVSMHIDCISNSATLSSTFHCKVLFVHAYKWRKWHNIWSHSFSVTAFNYLMSLRSCGKGIAWYTAQCKMLLFCARTIVKVSSNFEVACLKEKKEKKKKEKHFGSWATSWFGTVYRLCDSTSWSLTQL